MSDDRTKDLPVTPDQAYPGGAGGAGGAEGGPEASGPAFESDAGPHPDSEQVPSWRLVSTLALAGALAGLLIVGVFQWAQPQILEHRARVMSDAIAEVLGAPERVQTLYVTPDGLVPTAPAGADTITAEKVYLGYDGGGDPVGFAVVGAEPGFQDIIQLIFGYDPDDGRVLGLRVLESKETPGLGDKIMKDAGFVEGFSGVKAPLRGVKAGAETGSPEEVDMITGATISSRAVIGIINHRLEALDGMLKAYMRSGAGATAPGNGTPESGGAGEVAP